MTTAKRSSLPGQSAIYEESSRIISPPPLYRSDTPSVASASPLITPTASTGLPVSEEDSVKVTVRCRPPSKTELSKNSESCWEVDTNHNSIRLTELWAAKPSKVRKDFLYDNVFYGSDNELLYGKSVRSVIQSTMRGYNGTVFAYGQTASGKTYIGTEDEPGVVPRAVNDVFSIISETTEKEFLLRVSYLEIYNETLKDLLSPDSEDLRIHEDKKRGVYVSSLKEEIVTSPRHVMKVIQKGEANRHVSSTDFNLHSSRSHTVFQLIVESREKEPGFMPGSPTQKHNSFLRTDQRRSVQVSQLNLIDLAGSEKAASHTDRRKEGAFINKSLLTLGTVISKLTEDKVSSHIPYRDSKLTRILQSSLSGNARIAVICTISPSHYSFEESQNTLKFASRVKRIVTSAATNEIIDDKALLQKYRNEINDLRVQLQSNNEIFSRERETNITLLQEKQKHEEQLMEMQLVRTALKERIDHLTKLILTSGSISAKGTNEKPVPSLSNHTRSSPEDQSVDHVDKGDTDRLRRENTELQIIIDDLRETIRMQAAKLEQESNGHSKIQDESSHQNAEQQEVIRNLEESLRNVTDQKVQLEVDQGKLLAEIERLQDAATFVTNRNKLQHTQPVSAMEVEHSRTDDKVAGAGLSQALKEELEDMRVRCTTLEHERDSLKTHIKELQDDLDTLRLSMSALTQDVKQRVNQLQGSQNGLEKLSDTEDTPNEVNQNVTNHSKASEQNDDDLPSISETPLSPMFTLGPEIEYIVIALLLSVLVYLIVDREDDGILI